MNSTADLRRLLLDWYRHSRRDLPWRNTRDPWRILVSEVMLQQTRVAAVLPYYERFLLAYPTPRDLAEAPQDGFLALWSGLGYYSRARNLQKAAQQIVERGGFPERYEEIHALAGVGDYTAAAVASIAFGLPHAVLDGNVIRVLSRLSGDEGDVRAAATRERLRSAAQAMLDKRHPGDFNQALMELGATLCLPRDPQCLLCPLSRDCAARRDGRQNELPMKNSRRGWVRIEQTLLLARRNGCVLLRQRPPDVSRMPGFWELPEVEDVPGARIGVELGSFRHTITHHLYTIRVVEAAVRRRPRGMFWKPLDTLNEVPLSTTARKALQRCKKL